MSPELRELFEIKQNEENNKQPVSQNVTNHIVIRLAVIVFGSIIFLIAMSQAEGWGGLIFVFSMMIFHALWLLFIIIEAVILQGNGKFKLRNVNLIFTGTLLLLYSIGAALLFGGS